MLLKCSVMDFHWTCFLLPVSFSFSHLKCTYNSFLAYSSYFCFFQPNPNPCAFCLLLGCSFWPLLWKCFQHLATIRLAFCQPSPAMPNGFLTLIVYCLDMFSRSYCCGLGFGGDKRPPGGAVEPSHTEHRNLGRDSRTTPKGHRSLKGPWSPIFRRHEVGSTCLFQFT